MIIRVDQTGAVRVDGHAVFTDFHVEAPGGFSVPDLAAMTGTRASPEWSPTPDPRAGPTRRAPT